MVGGGLAGLTAARSLVDAGASVVVLEARDRVGGRTYSTSLDGFWFDLGGQWLGPSQLRMKKLVDEFSIATFPTYHSGKKVFDRGGKISTYSGTIPKMSPAKLVLLQRGLTLAEKMARSVSPEEPWSAPRAEEWDGINVEAWMRRHIPSQSVRDVYATGIRAVFGADPSEISLLHFLYYARSGGSLMELLEIADGAQETRFVNGSQQVALELAAQLGDRVVLNSPVTKIEHDERAVVSGDSGSWTAEHVIVAVPPALAGRIAYESGLPAARDALTQRFPMGSTIKSHVFYERPFWRDEGYSGEIVSTKGPVCVAFDNSSEDGSRAVLLCFAVGSEARSLGRLTEDARKEAVVGELVRWFGPQAARPTAYVDKDWAADPWTRGCPTGFTPPGTLIQFGPALRAPVGRIHWAGTETATEWTGYMEGAVESGERAASEVLSA